ncbi:PxKF domain-containing protein [Actinokineospora auranticolor]|uniref:PxKF domain-containing protein n=1 Tax=Actinokineospora auranticolor TaxID=155976 RepID=UPI0011B05216|nr:PxKF domain-containing protein [Actinokineospora auranticolor]
MSAIGAVSNSDADTVSVVDITNNAITATIAVGDTPYRMAMTPSGDTLYVTHGIGELSVIDTANNAVLTITGFVHTAAVAVRPDGARAYVSSYTNGTISVVDTATNTITQTFGGFDVPTAIAFGTGTANTTYPFAGFFAPVRNPPALNIRVPGRPVLARFSIVGYHGLGVLAAGSPTSQRVDCATLTPIGSPAPWSTTR